MVGDRENDITGARENGLRGVGVLFGYGSQEELAAAGAVGLAEDVGALDRLLRTLPRAAEQEGGGLSRNTDSFRRSRR